jgi:hypothetical protein
MSRHRLKKQSIDAKTMPELKNENEDTLITASNLKMKKKKKTHVTTLVIRFHHKHTLLVSLPPPPSLSTRPQQAS